MGGDKEQRPIRDGRIGPGDPDQYDYDQIAGFLEEASDTSLDSLSTTYGHARDTLLQAQESLANHALLMAAAWQSESADLAMEDLRSLHNSAGTLADASREFSIAMFQASRAVHDHQVAPSRTQAPRGVLPGAAAQQEAKRVDDQKARDHLRQMNADLVTAYNRIPATVTLEMPVGREGAEGPSGADTSGGGGTTSAGTAGALDGGSPGAGAPGISDQQAAGSNSSPGAFGSGAASGVIGRSPGPSDLAGIAPANPVVPGIGSGGSVPGGFGVPGGPGGVGPGGVPIGFAPVGPRAGGGGSGVVAPGFGPGARPSGAFGGPGFFAPWGATGPGRAGGFDPVGPGGVIRGGGALPGAPGSPGAAGGRSLLGPQNGVIGRTGVGAPFMPMGAPYGGGTSGERERETWLAEDEDVWRDGDESTSPPVID